MPTRYLTVTEAAERWGVTPSLVRRWCRDGRIRGAVEIGNFWAIPENAERPEPLPPGRKPEQD